MENKKYYQCVDELNALRVSRWGGLRFQSGIEAEFRADHARWYKQTIKQASALAVVFLLSGLFIETFWTLEVHPISQWGRLFAVVTVLSSAYYVSRSRHTHNHAPLLLVNGLVCSLVVLSFAYLSPPPIKQIYYAALFFVEVFVFAYMRLPFSLSLLCGTLLFIIATAVLTFDPVNISERVMIEFLLAIGTVLSLAVCHRLEKHERENFLQNRLIAMERDQLRVLNMKLQDRLACDGVTHLPNRRTFEDALLEVSERSRNDGIFLVVVMIEGFKNINENCGEDMGDDLLRSVARSLSATLSGGAEMAARVGGGKFAALWLCGTNADAEHRLERLQAMLQTARALKDSRLQGLPVHIASCTWSPAGENLDPRQYLEVAFARCQRKLKEKSAVA